MHLDQVRKSNSKIIFGLLYIENFFYSLMFFDRNYWQQRLSFFLFFDTLPQTMLWATNGCDIKRIREGSNNALKYLAMRSICLRLSSKGYMCYRTNTCLIVRKQATSLGFLAKIKWEGKSIPSGTITRLVVFCNDHKEAGNEPGASNKN